MLQDDIGKKNTKKPPKLTRVNYRTCDPSHKDEITL